MLWIKQQVSERNIVENRGGSYVKYKRRKRRLFLEPVHPKFIILTIILNVAD